MSRWIKCPECSKDFKYQFGDPKFKRDPPMANLTKAERQKVYITRYYEKKKRNEIDPILEEDLLQKTLID